MRTSLIELSLIEKKLSLSRAPVFSEDKELLKKIRWQRKAYKLIRLIARKDLKKDLVHIHKRLMKKPEFKEKVQDIYPQI